MTILRNTAVVLTSWNWTWLVSRCCQSVVFEEIVSTAGAVTNRVGSVVRGQEAIERSQQQKAKKKLYLSYDAIAGEMRDAVVRSSMSMSLWVFRDEQIAVGIKNPEEEEKQPRNEGRRRSFRWFVVEQQKSLLIFHSRSVWGKKAYRLTNEVPERSGFCWVGDLHSREMWSFRIRWLIGFSLELKHPNNHII